MNVDGNEIINILAERVAKLEVELAIKEAQVRSLEQQRKEASAE